MGSFSIAKHSCFCLSSTLTHMEIVKSLMFPDARKKTERLVPFRTLFMITGNSCERRVVKCDEYGVYLIKWWIFDT